MKKLALIAASTFVILTANALPSSASSLDKLDSVTPTIVNNLPKLESDDLISIQVESKQQTVTITQDYEIYPLFPEYYYYNSGGYKGYLSLQSWSYKSDGKLHLVYRGTVYKTDTPPAPNEVKDEM